MSAETAPLTCVSTTEASVPPALFNAIKELWRLQSPGPENLFTSQPFVHLRQTCEVLYPFAGCGDALGFALHYALCSFGLPCGLPTNKQHLAVTAQEAAEQLNVAFHSTRTSRTYLCPLDCADTLPPLSFGQVSVRTFTSSELEALVNLPQLQRRYPRWQMDAERLASFTWLIVKEEVNLNGEPGQRAIPVLFQSLDRDLGAIEPHRQRFPAAVEAALFMLLLAPWEEWAHYTDLDWRAFRTPWVYTSDSDVFCHRPTPPSPDTLTWEPCVYTDAYGEEVELERPSCLPLTDAVADAPVWLNDTSWAEVQEAQATLIFGRPVMHFLVRAFLSDGIDEFLAHITVIEAALGTKVDHDPKMRPKITGGRQGSTYRVAIRLAALLGDKSHAKSFLLLFDSRSEFLHGRTMQTIPGSERVLARRLARQVSLALVKAAKLEVTVPREVFLQRLLDVGQML